MSLPAVKSPSPLGSVCDLCDDKPNAMENS